jgi:hypothetical protein
MVDKSSYARLLSAGVRVGCFLSIPLTTYIINMYSIIEYVILDRFTLTIVPIEISTFFLVDSL